ncbi:MAG: hypothetical protein ACYDGM_13455, partial [Vulcanimicrobiaceae bacterium]
MGGKRTDRCVGVGLAALRWASAWRDAFGRPARGEVPAHDRRQSMEAAQQRRVRLQLALIEDDAPAGGACRHERSSSAHAGASAVRGGCYGSVAE